MILKCVRAESGGYGIESSGYSCVQRKNKKRETCGDRLGKVDLGAQQPVTNRPR